MGFRDGETPLKTLSDDHKLCARLTTDDSIAIWVSFSTENKKFRVIYK